MKRDRTRETKKKKKNKLHYTFIDYKISPFQTKHSIVKVWWLSTNHFDIQTKLAKRKKKKKEYQKGVKQLLMIKKKK